MKMKTPKPRVMWAAYYNTPNAQPTLHRSKAKAGLGGGRAALTGVARSIRVAVIPLDDVEAIVERATQAWEDNYGTVTEAICVALTAAGIPCAKRKARK